MREIKFRYWDGVSCYISETLAPKEELFVEPDVKEIMQYTGLYDKNGKEIYEGDVVEFKYANMKKLKRAEIQWGTGGFWVVGWYNKLSDYKAFEIIGNIYENPELLKEIK
jgi:hypothetical protein